VQSSLDLPRGPALDRKQRAFAPTRRGAQRILARYNPSAISRPWDGLNGFFLAASSASGSWSITLPAAVSP
jgi:hypothetical protein